MSEFRVGREASSKITGSRAHEAFSAAADDTPLRVIVKVNVENYVPAAVTLRERIDEMMFTADVPAGSLQRLEEDGNVASVAISEKLRVVE